MPKLQSQLRRILAGLCGNEPHCSCVPKVQQCTVQPGKVERSSNGAFLRSGSPVASCEQVTPMKSGHRKADRPQHTLSGRIRLDAGTEASGSRERARNRTAANRMHPARNLGPARTEAPLAWSRANRHTVSLARLFYRHRIKRLNLPQVTCG